MGDAAMSNQSRAYDEWQDRLVAGDKPTVENFVRSALAQDPPKLITIQVARLDPARWGFLSRAEMDAAFGEEVR